MDNDGIVLIMQRTRTSDLTGHLLAKTEQHWMHFKVPMEGEGLPGYNPEEDLGFIRYGETKDITDKRPTGKLMFPERFSKKAVASLKEDLGPYGSAGQLQQRPSPLGGGIIKQEYWTIWPDDVAIPQREHVFLSWDTAYSERDVKDASYSAMTAWGVFWHEQKQRHCLMVLGRWYGRVAYPVLRKLAQSMAIKYTPDAHLIEKKASGQSLIQDLRRTGSGRSRVKLRTYMPDRDKVSRAHTATATMAAGLVYIPNRPWAHELIAYCGEFPMGAPPSSDLTDTVTQAVLYLKKGWWVSHPDDDYADNTMPEDDYDEADECDEIEQEGMYG